MLSDRTVKMIDELEKRLRSLFLFFEIHGTCPKIEYEKYRQNEPTVTATWQGEDGIKRNLHLIVNEDGEKIVLEVNAWIDDEKQLKRHWATRIVDAITIKPESLQDFYQNSKIANLLFEGIHIVQGLKDNELTNINNLQPLPQS